MSCVDIRGCRIGEGRPKVILPIVERAEAAILEKAAQFSTLQADCVEWRVDYFEGARAARCCCPLSGKAAGRPEGQAAARHHPHEGRGRTGSPRPTAEYPAVPGAGAGHRLRRPAGH